MVLLRCAFCVTNGFSEPTDGSNIVEPTPTDQKICRSNVILMYGGVLATLGFGPICMGDAQKPVTQRMDQYPNRQTWMTHVSDCYQRQIAAPNSSLSKDKVLKCAHPRPMCAIAPHSTQRLLFHYQDVHCVEFTKGTKRCLSDTGNRYRRQYRHGG
jgi:hypothetical protein